MDHNTKIKSIHLNTRFAENNDLSNPRWILNEEIDNIISFKVKDVMIPLSSYNVNQYNNKFQINTSVGSIATGNYNSSTFPGAITTASSSFGLTTVNYNSVNNILSFGGSGINFETTSNDCYSQLGITNSQLNSATGGSFTSSNTLDLSGIKTLHFLSGNFNGIDLVNKPNFNILCSLPIEESQNTISTYNDFSADYIETTLTRLSQIQINLKDEAFRNIDQKTDWGITINFITE